MHNCKQTRKDLVDLALAEPPIESTQLLHELNECAACREEFAAIGSTLHVSGQALRTTVAGEEFWNGYHTRLRSRVLEHATQNDWNQPSRSSFNACTWLALKTFATSSVRLPVPVAVAALLFIGVSAAVLLMSARAGVNTVREPAVVQIRTVEVPVVQEKVITRVVYVEKKNGRGSEMNSTANSDLPNSVATIGSGATRKSALSLVGFKPTDQVQLTIIKGSSENEK